MSTVWLRFAVVAFLIVMNGFFVAVEFSVVAVQRARIRQRAQDGDVRAQIVGEWVDDPDYLIAGAQLGITIASLALGAIGERAVSEVIEPWLHRLPYVFTSAFATSLPLLISLTIITTLHVVLGEQVPKSATIRYPEKFILVAARPMAWFLRLFHPFISLLDLLAVGVLRLFGIRPVVAHNAIFSVEDLKQIVLQSQRDGVLDDQERQMLHAIFDLRKMLARQVMVPRTEMICVENDATTDTLLELAVEHPYTKFPVYHGDLDHIIGIVHTKDLLKAMREGRNDLHAEDLMRPALLIPETVRVDDLLAEFRRHHVHSAVLIDEFGGTAGFVTLEDLLEEIVGDVQGEFDEGEPEYRRLADGTIVLSGLMTIDEFNELFHHHLRDPNYDTMAGFILGRLGRMAQPGDMVEVDGIRLTVEAMDGRRIDRIGVQFVE